MVILLRLLLRFARPRLEQSLAEALYAELGEWNGEAFLAGARSHMDAVSIIRKKVSDARMG